MSRHRTRKAHLTTMSLRSLCGGSFQESFECRNMVAEHLGLGKIWLDSATINDQHAECGESSHCPKRGEVIRSELLILQKKAQTRNSRCFEGNSHTVS